ncbi:DUF5133 domain-containing protein [Streptomyces sp. ISL-43]|uniref:DUF5133 domain-containing protein n=1 Tax=Streptomyces sp. ISL-43 TaxID=2819183 RepID=UPI001BE97A74|nr:DUF5133 domain-containing protein [Streptomyces sp. ISL-43]MBT2450860.1 DUF5133 domain-containing protein [Streptomyces sp. ISL-43]
MATTPCSVRDAERILATAADLANVNVLDMAAAMTAGPGGTPVPVRLERALRHAIRAARTPLRPKTARTGVLPSRTRAEEVLSRLRGCQARLAATPSDPGALRAMDDAAYTLCVLMDRPTAHEAVLAAEELLATPA